MMIQGRIGFLLLATACGSTWANIIPSGRNNVPFSVPVTQRSEIAERERSSSFLPLSVRGGASKRQKKAKRASLSSSSSSSKKKSATGKPAVGAAAAAEPSALGSMIQKYRSILPLTRSYVTAIVSVTSLSMLLGEEVSQALLALDPIRTLYGLELWRPFSAASFLGKPSMGWLMSTYYLFEYGSSLERAFGTAQHAVFLWTQVVLLTVMSAVFGQPFFGQSMITAMLHVLSRSMPNQKVKWLIFTVPYWSLPYALMAGDVLQAGDATAALPHVMGILTGHCYYFHKFVWPRVAADNGGDGDEDWLIAPDFLRRILEPQTTSKDKLQESLEKARKKRGKGRKLGGS